MTKIAMLGSGLIGALYTAALHRPRGVDRVQTVYSQSPEHAAQFAQAWNIPKWTTRLDEAVDDPDIDVVVIALPNDLHERAALAAARAGKAVLCTKPLGRSADEAWRILRAVEAAGVFHGYLEDLVYTPKTLKAVQSVQNGAVGKVLWTRSRGTHSGPHSPWFWDKQRSGGGALIDMGCHCIEIGRSFIGKRVRPLEVMCWAETQVHPIEAEDSAVGLVRYASGAVGQFEASWTFRGGMDLRDEVSGTAGTILLNQWLRTGFELFTSVGEQGYVAEKAEGTTGWLFPIADEASALGCVDMFADMLSALEQGRPPVEDFYDGYVVNAIMDAAYRSVGSKRWEAVILEEWRGDREADTSAAARDYDAEHTLIKEEMMADGRVKLILKEKATGKVVEKVNSVSRDDG